MQSEPLVCAVMLTRDRPAMARRAVEAFRKQTYERKKLLVWDSSPGLLVCDQLENDGVVHVPAVPASIGAMRNQANAFWNTHDIVIHWDSDDWSHPNRIAEQVALLQASGADAVGYNEMLFWRTFPRRDEPQGASGEAWLFANRKPGYVLGTSLCYWRRTWERKSFSDLNVNEDTEWIRGLNVLPETGFFGCGEPAVPTPAMIASIHGANTSGGYDIEDLIARGSLNWKRAPEWDDFCRRTMQL